LLSFIDAYFGFHQIKMARDDRKHLFAPVVGGGEEEVGELLDNAGKLSVGPIGVVGGRRRVLDGEQKAAVVEIAGTHREAGVVH
jgi:hypothetical protein